MVMFGIIGTSALGLFNVVLMVLVVLAMAVFVFSHRLYNIVNKKFKIRSIKFDYTRLFDQKSSCICHRILWRHTKMGASASINPEPHQTVKILQDLDEIITLMTELGMYDTHLISHLIQSTNIKPNKIRFP
jgi:hypothetical protein